jgi:hypothetical protein
MPKEFSDFRDPKSISVWVGDFRTEGDLDDYLNSQFESDFGFSINPRAVCEAGVRSQPMNIDQLVQGFSRAQTFSGLVVEAANKIGCTTASAMFIIYFFAYDSSQIAPDASAPLKFLGVIPFTGFS